MAVNLEYYRIFLEVAGQGNISRAAVSLNLSQPTVTKELKMLEQQLGLALFVRKARGVELTVEGRFLYDRICGPFSEIEKAESELDSMKKLDTGTVNVCFTSFNFLVDFITVIKEFKSIHPNVNVYTSVIHSGNVNESLSRGNVDIVFSSISAYPEDDPAENSRQIFTNPMLNKYNRFVPYPENVNINISELNDICITKKELADKLTDSCFIKDLGEFPFLISRCYFDCYDSLIGCPATERPRDIFMGETKSIFSVLKNEDYIAIVPKLSYMLSDLYGCFSEIAIKDKLFTTTQWLSYSKKKPLSIAAREFLHFVLEHRLFKDHFMV